MTLDGTVRDGVIVLDTPPRALAEGTRVKVVVADEGSCESPHADLLALAGTVEGLPPDLARNHDHYLHGHPKK
jgi:hypothetical protein